MSSDASKEDGLARWRPHFPILERCVYLNSNSLGAIPEDTFSSLHDYAATWAGRGVRAWEEGWWELPRAVGDLLGHLLGAGPGEVSIQPSVSAAQWVLFSALESKGRNRIVYSSLNFPSVRYFYQAQPGLEIDVVESSDGITVPTEEMIEAIDERTLLVPISHVLFTSGYLQEARKIIDRAHQMGAYVALDTYHSCGVIPFSVRELNVDFAVGGVLKWLCGGPGVAFLYVRPDLAEKLTPRLTGWLAHEAPFEFEPSMRWTNGPYRFMSGTPNIPGLYAARRGLEIISEVGVEAIRRHSLCLTDRIIERADEIGVEIKSPRPAGRRGGHISLHPPRSREVAQALLESGFVIDYRPEAGLRVAPHFYNTLEEVEEFMEALAHLKEEGRVRESGGCQ